MMQAKNKFTRVKNLRRSNYVDTIFNATGKRTVAAEKMALRDGCWFEESAGLGADKDPLLYGNKHQSKFAWHLGWDASSHDKFARAVHARPSALARRR